MRKSLGWSVELLERPKKPAPKEVLMALAREWAKEGVKVDWEHLLPPKASRCCLVGGWWNGRSLESTSKGG